MTAIEVVVTKEINAPVESVYAAWVTPDIMRRWFAPGNVMVVADAQVDLREGGEYLIHMHDPEEKSDHIVSGTYEEIVPNKKLAFNWMWKDGVDRSHVSIEFTEKEQGITMLTLRHVGFSQQDFADKHEMGWNGCLANLDKVFAS